MKTETKQALKEYYKSWQRYNEQLKHLEKDFSFDSVTDSLTIVRQMALLEGEFMRKHSADLHAFIQERSGADSLVCFLIEDKVYYGPTAETVMSAYFTVASLIEE